MSVVPSRLVFAELPAALADLIDNRPRPIPAPVVDTRTAEQRMSDRLDAAGSGNQDENFARRVLDDAAAEMRATGPTTHNRNDTLNRLAYDLYGLAKGGRIAEDVVTSVLTEAALTSGLGQREIDQTLRSALRTAPAKTGAPLRNEQAGPQGPSTADLVAAATAAPETTDEAHTATERPEETVLERQRRREAERAQQAENSALDAVRQLAQEMWDELLTSDALINLPPPRPLIKGLLMRDSLAVLYGKPGNGKSFVTIDWALCIATGTWWDMRPVHSGAVLYIAAEGAPGLGKRVRAWQDHHGYTNEVPGFVVYPRRVNLLDTLAPAAMVLVAKRLDPQLIVIDTLSRSMPGGNENAPEDMTRALENADLLRRETGATVLIVHHTPKDGGSIRGHSSLEGAVDTAIEVRKAEAVVTISVEKQKDAPEAAPIVRYLRPVQFGVEPDPETDSAYLSSRGDADAEERASTASQREVYIVLERNLARDEAMPNSRWEDLAKEAGYSRATFHRAKKALAEEGFVRNVGTVRTPKWQIAKPWS